MGFQPNFGRPADGPLHVGSGYWAMRAGGRPHGALDIAVPTGTPVRAMQDGVVIVANPTNNGDAGLWVGIQHPQLGGLISRYMHFSKLGAVKVGDRVRKGQIIGLSGATGDSAIPHVHVDLKIPQAMLPAVQAAAGKPSVGWIPLQAGYGYGIPAEPWVPIDSYRADTVANAQKYGIPLYAQMSHGGAFIVELAVAAFVAWGLLQVLR